MSDLELIELLQQKSAGELTPAEIDAIRARWTQSPALRQALVEHLHLETQLIGGLIPVQLDVDAILQRAAQYQKTSRSPAPWPWLITFVCMLAAGGGLFVFLTSPAPQPEITKNETAPPVLIEVFPADALQPSNQVEPSADSALLVAMGESPNPEPTTTPVPRPNPTIEPMPKPAVVEVAPNEPWSSTLARDVAPWAAESPKLATEYKSAGHDEFPDVEARRWLSPVEGQPYQWSTDPIGTPARRIAKFQGLAKLRAPWPADAVLRITPLEVTDLTLYFWQGPTGVALRFYTRREPHLWAAFEISRENSSPKPARFGLLTTDSGTYFRSTPGMLDIRHQEGELVLARGGIVLLTVPFVGLPTEVFMEGQFRLRGLSMHRSAPFPSRREDEHQLLVSGPAADLPWALSAESPASFVSNPDGSIAATMDSTVKTGLLCLPFGWMQATSPSPLATGTPATGLYEVIVNVESADPGTGIFLGDRDGRPLQQLAFFRDTTTQQTTFGILRPGEVRTEATYNPNDFPPPYLPKSCWLKLTAGLGTLHIQTSADGHHWGHVIESPGRDLPGAVGSMGLFGLPGPAPRTIRLREVQVRELTGVTSVADRQLRSLVRPFTTEDWKDLAVWNQRVLDTRPGAVDPDAWLTANAVVALSQGPPKELGSRLLRQLVTSGLRSKLPFKQKRQLLDDACALTDLFDDVAAKTLGMGYEDLGWQLADAGDERTLAKIRTAWLESPIWTSSKMRYVWERLHSQQILQAVYRRDWPVAWRLAQSASYWNQLPHPDQKPTERGEDLDRHARWAKGLVAEAAAQLDDGTAGVLPIGWRHPLTPVLNKEAYNIRAELQSALTGQTYEDACRIVMSITGNDGPGMLPDPEDRQLYVSMPTAIATARKTYPDFARTMVDQFEPLGRIRVQAALNRKDFASLQIATLQFMGTDASRQAHVVLGEVALSLGQFDVAQQHFQDAAHDAGLRWKEILEPRMLLAQGLGGNLTAPQVAAWVAAMPGRPVELNGTVLSAVEFQGMLNDLVNRSTTGSTLYEIPNPPAIALPQFTYKLEPRAQFDGHPGNNPGRGEYRFGDPFGRQFAMASDELRIYVSNRFQVNAYSTSDGKQIWAQGIGSEQGEAYGLPFAPMKPLVTKDRLFVRRLTKAGAELACLKPDDGQVLWHQRPFQSVVTDPVIWNGRLFAVTLAKAEEDQVQVEATWFDAASGNVLMSRPLYRFREGIDRQFSGQLTVQDRVAVCTIAGTTASFDSRGEMRWLRRHPFLQKPVDELAEDARAAAPVIHSGRVITTQGGVRAVCCLDLDSGEVLWEKPIFPLRGLLGVAGNRALVDTVAGLIALDTATGEVAWQRSVDFRLEAIAWDPQTVTFAQRQTATNNRSKPVLVWLDLQTGEEQCESLIEVADREEFQLGPLFTAGGRWWSLVGQTWKDPKRELHEFIPLAAIPPKSSK